jgi:hypothetical protein
VVLFPGREKGLHMRKLIKALPIRFAIKHIIDEMAH